MLESWLLAREMIFAPSKALKRIQGEHGIEPAIGIFVLVCALSVVFYTLKPFDFPPPDPDFMDLPLGLEAQGWLFWTRVQAWEPFLTAILVVFLAWFCAFFRSPGFRGVMSFLDSIELDFLPPILSSFLVTFVVRFIPFLMLVAVVGLLGLLPLAPNLLYTRRYISRPVFFLLWIALVAGMLPGLRRVKAGLWRSLASLVLSLYAVNLALMLPFAAAVWAGSARAYHALEFAMVGWTLFLGSYLVSRIAELRTPRAFAALFLSVCCQTWFVFALHLLGLVSSDILKAMMSV